MAVENETMIYIPDNGTVLNDAEKIMFTPYDLYGLKTAAKHYLHQSTTRKNNQQLFNHVVSLILILVPRSFIEIQPSSLPETSSPLIFELSRKDDLTKSIIHRISYHHTSSKCLKSEKHSRKSHEYYKL